jgi:hypothetical protein
MLFEETMGKTPAVMVVVSEKRIGGMRQGDKNQSAQSCKQKRSQNTGIRANDTSGTMRCD